MLNIRCKELKHDDYVGKYISIKGWIHRIRKQKENTFLLIRDDRGDIIQCIIDSSKTNNLSIESSIEIFGIVQKDPRAPEGGYELKADKIHIVSISQNDYPIGEYQSLDLLLDKRHLALRTRRMTMVSKIRSSVLYFSRKWFTDNDWIEVTPPVIVKGAVEGGSTLFSLKYFDENAYLSQSAQLYLEAMIFSLGPVWSITSSFRAEKSRTVRHLTEFLHLEAEAPWISLEDLLQFQEDLVSFIIQNILRKNKNEFEFLKRDISELEKISPPFDRITYEKAIDILRKEGLRIVDKESSSRLIEYGDDLNIESERLLTLNSSKPLFVIGYPLNIKPFYVKEEIAKEGIGIAADLLAPNGFGEITSGGIREDDLRKLENRMVSEGLEKSNYEWYLDLRRYGSVPHGGFGLGIERLMRWILNIIDIKDTLPFPRTLSRIYP
ncbi:MAG TPA: asparagine--tRNA ligase [Nitrososphaeraceae archaeon]|nr:asparagine--tRNA ligase [Nitrososphaeraceae archaeon]